MNIFHSHYDYLKESASLLLKRCLNKDDEAIARFRALKSFSELSKNEGEIIASLQLKDALAVIAVENGYQSWAELKSALDYAAETSPLAEIKDQFYPKGYTTYWNIWFAKYSQAKKVLDEGKDFYFPSEISSLSLKNISWTVSAFLTHFRNGKRSGTIGLIRKT